MEQNDGWKNTHWQICTLSLVISKLHTNAAVRECHTFIGMTKTSNQSKLKQDKIECWQGCGPTATVAPVWQECQMGEQI